MNTREIVTLQFGHYSNFVGAHWWNSQELSFEYNSNKTSEINHDVLFREGLTTKGEVTYTPRVLLADLKGSLKSLPREGNLYASQPHGIGNEVDANWFKPPELKVDAQWNKNDFQTALEANKKPTAESLKILENEVDVWSDFLYTRYHPRTVNIVNEYEHDNFNNEFDSFPLGCSIWKTHDYEDEFTDKIRLYIEECDNFQGFHVLMDSTDGFSGLATSCIEYLSDEYDTKTIFAMPLIPGSYPCCSGEEQESKSKLKDSIRVLNLAFSYMYLADEASLFTPLSTSENGWRQPGPAIDFNHLDYKVELPYHSSAIIASAIDTFTLKYRLKSTNYLLCDLAVDLTSSKRKAVAGSLCLPFSVNQGVDLIDCLDNWDGPLAHSVTPRCKIGDTRMMQVVTLRGIPEDRLKRPLSLAGKQQDMPAYKCHSVAEMLNMYYAFTTHGSVTNVTSVEKGLCVKPPFPQIFRPEVGIQGNIMPNGRTENIGVDSVPVLAGLHTGSEMGSMLEKLHTETRKIRFARFHQFIESGYGKDEFEECLDKLFTLRECYEDNYLI